MSKKYSKELRNRKRRIGRRLARQELGDRGKPILKGRNIHYEMSEKMQGLFCGGIGAFHKMVKQIGLAEELDKQLHLLKIHKPYYESDHILTIAYNILTGNKRLEDIEHLRQDEGFLNALGADRIPDPTTAGDFTRRFEGWEIERLQNAINEVRQRVWRHRGKGLLKDAYVDVDGTVASTTGRCKEGMEWSYKGVWGYAPLIVSLANTQEVLYLVNRPGNAPSQKGAAKWIEKAIELVKPYAKRLTLRGDTDFSLMEHLDKWSEKAHFVFGMDARKKVVGIADELEKKAWEALERSPKYTVKTKSRQRPENIQKQIVKRREFERKHLTGEEIAEFDYRPFKCKKEYRVVVLRKNISVEKGESVLFDEIRYFFYITTRRDLSAKEVVELANKRCNQENVVEQLKNGVNAMRMPVNNLLSNWAYMVMAALAWNLKAWFALLMPNRKRGVQVLKMEFRRFLRVLILLPCQIIRSGRKIIYRLMSYNPWLEDFLDTWEYIRRLALV